MTQVEAILNRLFEKHRLVFWYDEGGAAREEFEGVAVEEGAPAGGALAGGALAGVVKLEVAGNEFGVKYRVLKQEPQQKFLLYFAHARPADAGNWLLDLLLANAQFHADRDALLLADLGLGDEFRAAIADHREFFAARARVGQLRSLLRAQDTLHQVRLKMCAVCAGLAADSTSALSGDLSDVVFALFDEAAGGGTSRYEWFRRFNLEGWFWARVQESWGYRSSAPTPLDFAVQLFATGYAPVRGSEVRAGEAPMSAPAAHALLRRWKESERHKDSFVALSGQAAELLEIERDVAGRNFRTLATTDLFEVVDRAILRQLVAEVSARTVPASEVAALVGGRRGTRWYKEFAHEYEAALAASNLLEVVATTRFDVPSIEAGVNAYAKTWFRIDQAYRHFVWHAQASAQASLFEALATEVENSYTNRYLYRLANHWQERVDALSSWPPAGVRSQRDFFEEYAASALQGDAKLFVIISDALRYEIGDELLGEIRRLDRFEVELEASLAPLPSYTQLGMAALLPRGQVTGGEQLRIDVESGAVSLGSRSTAGRQNRRAILQEATAGRATAITAEEFANMTFDEYRALYRDNRIVYLYQDVIDARGHSLGTEERVFGAVEEAMREIVGFVRKASSANFLNIIVTADHGFLYQNRAIDESDFAATPVEGGAYQDRRFVLGAHMQPNARHKYFDAAALGLAGDYKVALPKGMLRLRKSGSSIRYVHGGATLQEVVVPVLRISKAKKSDVRPVDVQLVRNGAQVISTNQFAVRLFQVEPVSEKVRARRLTVGLYSAEGRLISESATREFASTDALPERREQTIQLVLNQHAESANQQNVELRLTEIVEGTTVERLYRKESYTLRRTFGSDFDF